MRKIPWHSKKLEIAISNTLNLAFSNGRTYHLILNNLQGYVAYNEDDENEIVAFAKLGETEFILKRKSSF